MRRALRNGIEVTAFKGSVSCRGAGFAVNEADQDFGPLCVFSASSTSPDSSGYEGWGHDLAIALAAGGDCLVDIALLGLEAGMSAAVA